MIYSENPRFIFIKSNKTGGTSAEIALSRIVQARTAAVVTPVSAEDELLRMKLGGCSPQNCYVDPWISPVRHSRAILSSAYHSLRRLPRFASGLRRFLSGREAADEFVVRTYEYRNSMMRPLLRFRNHVHACQVKDLLGEDLYLSSYRFGFTRNPVSRALSHYTWNQFEDSDFPSRTLADHRDAFLAHVSTRYSSTAKFFCDRSTGRIIVDAVFKYENLEESLVQVCQRLGVDPAAILPLPVAKAQYGQSVLPFPRDELVTAAARAVIRERCSWEYEHFDYA
jgi:hypothetical protein